MQESIGSQFDRVRRELLADQPVSEYGDLRVKDMAVGDFFGKKISAITGKYTRTEGKGNIGQNWIDVRYPFLPKNKNKSAKCRF